MRAVHPLLQRQLRECRRTDGGLDVDRLLAEVSATYVVHDRERHAQERTTERELRQSRTLLGTIIENVPHGIITKDVREGMKIVLCNRAAVGLFGFAPDEAIGRHAADLMPSAVARETSEDEARVCQDRAPMSKTVTRHSRKGDELTIDKRLIPLVDDAGTVTHVLEIFEDVTSLRAQARKLREVADQAEAANRAKSAFLATMSHEIRTPMNGVLGMTGLLLDSSLDETQRRFAKLIEVSAENLLALIGDILDMSKIEAGRLSIEEVELDLGQVCQAAVDVVRPAADAKAISLTLCFAGGLARARRGDRDRLRQVLVNLLGNAVKFTERGSVELAVNEGSTPGTLRFEVRDTGIGIRREHLGKLFQDFVQVDSSATRRFGGSGLGLAICKKLVELMGGAIGVETEASRGSTFWFEVPAPLGTVDRMRLHEIVARVVLRSADPSAPGREGGHTRSSAVHNRPDVDVDQLAELEDTLGAARLGQLVAEARGAFESKLVALALASAHDDREELAKLAHSLVGSAGAVGLVAASRSARALETACTQAGASPSEASAHLVETLRRGLGELDDVLRRRREREPRLG